MNGFMYHTSDSFQPLYEHHVSLVHETIQIHNWIVSLWFNIHRLVYCDSVYWPAFIYLIYSSNLTFCKVPRNTVNSVLMSIGTKRMSNQTAFQVREHLQKVHTNAAYLVIWEPICCMILYAGSIPMNLLILSILLPSPSATQPSPEGLHHSGPVWAHASAEGSGVLLRQHPLHERLPEDCSAAL